MEKKGKVKFGMILLIGILLVLVFANFILAYSVSSSQYTRPGMSSFRYLKGQGIDIYPMLDKEKCGAGQDFIIQVSPLGCQPAVVRSDLLEEQNTPVLCPLMATKVNPLIDVEAINYITFKGKYPEGVLGVGFHPARAAIKSSYKTMLNSPVLENIGYAVIVLKKQPNEASMPEWIEGNLTANIRYDIKNAFGVGQASYYLPQMSEDDKWKENYRQYGFWKGKGYLRAEAIGTNDARISIYKDVDSRVSTVNLQEGETSGMIYMPGYYCLAGMQLKLIGLESPDTRAKLVVEGDVIEVKDGERFLDNKCKILDLDSKGINQRVKIYCDVDEGNKKFELSIRPKIRLNIDGVEGDYEVGQKIGVSDDPNKDIFVGAAYTKGNSGKVEDLKVYFIRADTPADKLDEKEINSIYRLADYYEFSGRGDFAGISMDILEAYVVGVGTKIYKWLVKGENFNFIKYGSEKEIFGKRISVVGFAEPLVILKKQNLIMKSLMKNLEAKRLKVLMKLMQKKVCLS